MVEFFLAIVALAFTTLATAQVAPLSRAPAIAPAQTVRAHSGVVTAQEQRAARIGTGILDRGGNAVDAAVATGFALAVTYPRAGNIGGGGFMVIHLAKDNRDIAIDYRETAPAAASSTMFLDAQGNAGSGKVARQRALGRHPRHRRRSCDGARKIRLGKIHARRPDCAGNLSRAERIPG